jgi:uncharacterized membrane protein YjjB (DUF3815 family)
MKAIYDVPTAALAIATFAILWRYKVSELIVVVAAGAIGLVLWRFTHGG